MNKIFLIGRISNDLELRQTTTNKSTTRFNLAVNRIGEGTDFITIQAWNNQAENLCKYQSKGSLISIEGSLRVESYEDNEGNKRTTTYVLANNIEYLSSKSNNKPLETAENEEVDPFIEFGDAIDDNLLD